MNDKFVNEAEGKLDKIKKFAINDLLNFDKFITPPIAKIIYVLGLLATIVSCFFSAKVIYYLSGGFLGFLMALIYFVVMFLIGALLLRISVEIVLVIFDIRKNLVEIKNKTKD